METRKTGTTTVGIKYKSGIVMAAESKATMGNLVASKEAQKIYAIDDKIAVTTAGSAGDSQQLVRIVQAEINLYKIGRGSEITVNAVSTLLSNILQASRYYPWLAMMILGGVDKKGAHLCSLDPIGGGGDDEYISTGSGSPMAYGVLEDGYKKNMTKEEAIKLAVRSIRAARERDIYSGGLQINVVAIEDSGMEFVNPDKIAELVK
ncbi:MAG: archaeal proteasome endopeptidase complex subunit beta [Candidatus Aenigmarchaeota archaeon]|nr:archaeal proteasome endopeptidase complex subunit beta [Candidatus Aenigmarchaeota archaeon]